MTAIESIAWQVMQLWRATESFLGCRNYLDEEWSHADVKIPYAFLVLHEATLYDMVGAAGRLGDQQTQGRGSKKYENMSIDRFVTRHLKEISDDGERKAATRALSRLNALVRQNEVREFRNQIVSHACAATERGEIASPSISRQLMEQFCRTAEEVLQALERTLPTTHRQDLSSIRAGLLRAESFSLAQLVHTNEQRR